MTSRSQSTNTPDMSSDTPDIPVGLPEKPFRTTISDTNEFRAQMPSQSMHRAGFGKAGKQAKIQINSHIVKAWPERPVYQYDVSLFFLQTASFAEMSFLGSYRLRC